jgi:squalene monooxygenase
MAVFKYLQCGGANAQESIAILSGLNRSHYSLIKQFCFLAVFGAYNLLSFNILNLPKAIKLLSDAFKIINPLIKNELSTGTIFYHYIAKKKYLPYFGYSANIQKP